MTELKDYLHLYLGCECETPLGVMELSSIDLHYQYPVWFRYKEKIGKPLEYIPQKNYDILVKNGLRGRAFYFNEVKPILRPLSGMTGDEALIIANISGNMSHVSNESKIFQVLEVFRSNGFYNKQTNLTGSQWNKIIIFCRKQSIDVDGLIESGLAIKKIV